MPPSPESPPSPPLSPPASTSIVIVVVLPKQRSIIRAIRDRLGSEETVVGCVRDGAIRRDIECSVGWSCDDHDIQRVVFRVGVVGFGSRCVQHDRLTRVGAVVVRDGGGGLVDVANGDHKRLINKRTVLRLAANLNGVAAVGFKIQRRSGRGDHTGHAIDHKASTRTVDQRVCDGVGGRIRIAGVDRHSDRDAGCRVLIDFVGRAVGVATRDRVEFVNVINRDGEILGAEGAVGRIGSHGDRLRCPVGFSVDIDGGGDFAGDAIDLKQTACGIRERVCHGVIGGVVIAREGHDADIDVDAGVFNDAIELRVVVGDRADIEFVHVIDQDREGFVRERTVGGGGSNRDVVKAGGFAIDTRSVGHADDARI